MRSTLLAVCSSWLLLQSASPQSHAADRTQALPKVHVTQNGFQTEDAAPFVPFGVTYYRPGTGWAPQLWKQFDAEATRADFARLKTLGANCVRVFISYGSFFMDPDRLDPEGLAKFDQLLAIAEAEGFLKAFQDASR